jgi:hypothetical protein
MKKLPPEEILSELTGIPIYRLLADDNGEYIKKSAALQAMKRYAEQGQWIDVNDGLPEPLKTVWLTNGKGWVCLGCLVEDAEGSHWAESNGTIYIENNEIVSECESEDLDVKFWHYLPKTPTK